MSELTLKEIQEWAADPDVLRRGEYGPSTGIWQRLMQRCGVRCGPVDNDFGGLTEAGTRRFQVHRILGIDGSVGPETKGAALHAFEENYHAGEPFLYPGTNIQVYGGIHPTMNRLPDDGGKVSWFGGPDDPGDRIYGQALVPVFPAPATIAKLYEQHPGLVDLGLFRKGLSDPLPMVTDWKGRTRQAGISWCLDPMSFYIAMRWEHDDRAAGISPLHHRVIVIANDRACVVSPSDFGPAEWTEKDGDLSLGALRGLKLKTGHTARFAWACEDEALGITRVAA
jgi:hypothetical protein